MIRNADKQKNIQNGKGPYLKPRLVEEGWFEKDEKSLKREREEALLQSKIAWLERQNR